ncbi:hypothetical protein SCUCBS95973_005935 [Sporothrix curviconia]|uniref:Uncharacterized protein n=1 Tax=Sporothrix curviconia TaxID=1260050 RepID=A0ABP0C0W9_9PEZI
MSNGVVPNGTASHAAGGDNAGAALGPAVNGGVGSGTGTGTGLGPNISIQPPSLPQDEDEDYDWDVVEENWLHQIATARATEDRDMVQEYDAEESILHAELDDAICEHNRLTEMLLQARVLVDEKKADIEWLVDEFKRRRKAVEDRRAADDFRVRAWINKGRKLVDARNRRGTQPEEEQQPPNGGPVSADGVRQDGPLPFLRSRHGTSTPTNGTAASSANGLGLSPTNAHHRHAFGFGAGSPSRTTTTTTTTAAAAAAQAAPDASTRTMTNGRHAPAYPHGPPISGDHVSVVNTDGDVVGIVTRIRAENHWVHALLDRTVVRPVEVRPGRKFTQAHLDAIYGGHDQKRSKWLSFMIQATGELQDRACQTCARGQGLFSLCIIVGGPDFPRCGNCEWNKQGCHGAVGSIANGLPGTSSASAPTTSSSKQKKKQSSNPQADQLHGLADQPGSTAGTPLQKTAQAEIANGSPTFGSPMAIDKQSQSPFTRLQAEPFVVRELSPPLGGGEAGEITLAMIASKDDGMIFLEPDLMYGVPLRKISPDHAYWEPSWKPIEGTVQTKLEEWTDKLARLKSLPETSLSEKERTAVFQAGRQVNRGKATMRYLENCDFHPYQLVAKKWITPSLTHYDTLFRMVATLDELAKFRLDVTPLQWLRQRLYELYCEKKSAFKLDRAIAKLYHDPKLAHLRSKNGFGNIGRPSAASKPRHSEAHHVVDSERRAANEKRKEAPNGDAGTPSKRSTAAAAGATAGTTAAADTAVNKQTNNKEEGSAAARPAKKPTSRSAGTARAGTTTATTNPRSRKRAFSKSRDTKAQSVAASGASGASATSASPNTSRAASHVTDGAPATAEDSDLEHSGYTTTDSLTLDTVVKKDWRVHQVKTKNLATNPQTTQYWHWVDRKQAYRSRPGGRRAFDPMFEHQVLKETEPVTSWGVFADPVDFHLRLRELTEVAFAPGTCIVVIGTREVEGIDGRGNVLAEFKRERTKRRFLSFLQKKGVPLRRTERHVIEDEWNGITAEVMAGNESD